jgi:hypothetical protein
MHEPVMGLLPPLVALATGAGVGALIRVASAVGGLIEMEIERPDAVRVRGSQALDRLRSHSAALAARRRPAEAVLPPQTADALVIYQVALPEQKTVCHPPAPGRMRPGDGPQAPAKLGLGVGWLTGRKAPVDRADRRADAHGRVSRRRDHASLSDIQPRGRMFALSRNTLAGSYVSLTATRRA